MRRCGNAKPSFFSWRGFLGLLAVLAFCLVVAVLGNVLKQVGMRGEVVEELARLEAEGVLTRTEEGVQVARAVPSVESEETLPFSDPDGTPSPLMPKEAEKGIRRQLYEFARDDPNVDYWQSYEATLLGIDWSAEQEAWIREIIAQHDKLIDRLLAGEGVPRPQRDTTSLGMFSSKWPPELEGLWGAGMLAALKARLDVRDGRAGEALELCGAMLDMSAQLGKAADAYFQHVSRQWTEMTAASLRHVLRDTSLSGDDAGAIALRLDRLAPRGVYEQTVEYESLGRIELYEAMRRWPWISDEAPEPWDDRFFELGISFLYKNTLLNSDELTYLRTSQQAFEIVLKPYHEGRQDFEELTRYVGEPLVPFVQRDTMGGFPRAPVALRSIWGLRGTYINQAKHETLAAQMRTALELNAYRGEHGAYPEDLSVLETSPPQDPFTGKPMVYEQTEEGYTLTSMGEDGKEEGEMQHRRRSDNIVWRMGDKEEELPTPKGSPGLKRLARSFVAS